MAEYDSIIIGAGMGGLCAAARLTAAGHKVLVAEKSPYLGGRCSHRDRGPYRITTGAIMVPMAKHSAITEAFDLVGAPMEMIELTGRMRYRLAHGDFDQAVSGGGLRGVIEFAFEDDRAGAQRLFQEFLLAMENIPDDSRHFRSWLDEHTDNAGVKQLFQGFCAALMGTNTHEIPAGEFFRFLKYSSRGSRFGMAANGNGEMMDGLAAAIEARGSKIARRTSCEGIVVADGAATGVVLNTPDGGTAQVTCTNVLSNTGPVRTIELAGGRHRFASGYLEKLDAAPHEAPIFHISFATEKPLIDGFDGCLVFGNNKNLIYLEIPSLISPALAPQGKVLHTAFGAPCDAANVDLQAELENTLKELRQNFPGQLDDAEFLVRAKHSGQAPGMHRWAGHMMPVTTPIRNLFNVGDGSTPPGTIGTEGAAGSAREAVKIILGVQALRQTQSEQPSP